MISATEIRKIKSLKHKKFRQEFGLFCAEGEKIINDIIEFGWTIEIIYATEDWAWEHKVSTQKFKIRTVNNYELGRISHLTTPNKVLALLRIPERGIESIDINKKIILALDNIQDPGNLGTIIRTADWFGVDTIVCSYDTADVYNPKVVQASMGSFARVKLWYVDLSMFFDMLPQGIPLMGAFLNGSNIFRDTPPESGVIVLGNESKGISAKILGRIKYKLKIPMFEEGIRAHKPDSLNVAVAAGILLGWVRNQE